jgi:NADPH-dependent 2,4-dienoyl-CoA reductase/sulfur reductase-like enzyme
MSITRRNFIKAFGAAAALATTAQLSHAGRRSKPKPAPTPTVPGGYRVVVVGGGFAGATVAKYIRMWSGYQIDVTLVDPNAAHTSCVLSNLVLNGRMQLSELQLPLARLAQNHGVSVVLGAAVSVGSDSVTLDGGASLNADRVVLAPGISFKDLPGVDFAKTPHAWIAGPQTTLLRQQLSTLRKGDTFLMTIPPAPYRCPPGPYERACLVADMLKRLGGGKVVVLDANSGIVAERHTFDTAFSTIYRDIVDYQSGVSWMNSVDSEALRVGSETGKVVNVIAPHSAPEFLKVAGLTNAFGWAPVNPLTYESTLVPGVHVIGDACDAPKQPKSGHMANSQAKVCADAIVRYSLGFDPLADGDRTSNITTNSACYSPITYSEASWLTANYRYDNGQMELATAAPGEARSWDGENFEDMFTWASNLFTDSFT